MTRKTNKVRPANPIEIVDSVNSLGGEWAEIAAMRLQKGMMYATLLQQGTPQSHIDIMWPEIESSEEYKESTEAAKDIIINCFTAHILKAAAEGRMGVEVVVVDKTKEVD